MALVAGVSEDGPSRLRSIFMPLETLTTPREDETFIYCFPGVPQELVGRLHEIFAWISQLFLDAIVEELVKKFSTGEKIDLLPPQVRNTSKIPRLRIPFVHTSDGTNICRTVNGILPSV